MYSLESAAAAMASSSSSSSSGMPAAFEPLAAIRLHDEDKWRRFHKHTNEMIVTKHGRRLFPHLVFSITGLSPNQFYNFWITMERVDRCQYKYSDAVWSATYCKEDTQEESAVGSYVHPESPKTGAEWMSEEVSFEKLKITNNPPPVDGSVIFLKTMRKYIPVVHIADVSNPMIVFCHSFPETSFIAVTAYQNTDVTHLKIHYNKFAKGQKVELSVSYGSTGEEMNQSSDLSTFSSPEQRRHSFNFSSPDTSFNSQPGPSRFASIPYWDSSPLSSPNPHLRQHSTPPGYTDVYTSYPPQSYMTNDAVSYQQPHSYERNSYHYQQQQLHQQRQRQQQYVHRQNNSSLSQYHPYKRPSYTWNS